MVKTYSLDNWLTKEIKWATSRTLVHRGKPWTCVFLNNNSFSYFLLFFILSHKQIMLKIFALNLNVLLSHINIKFLNINLMSWLFCHFLRVVYSGPTWATFPTQVQNKKIYSLKKYISRKKILRIRANMVYSPNSLKYKKLPAILAPPPQKKKDFLNENNFLNWPKTT